MRWVEARQRAAPALIPAVRLTGAIVLACATMIAPRASRRHLALVIGLLTGGVLGALFLATALGVERIDWRAVWVPGSADHVIVSRVRLGRALLGALVGGALAVAGVAFQTLSSGLTTTATNRSV